MYFGKKEFSCLNGRSFRLNSLRPYKFFSSSRSNLDRFWFWTYIFAKTLLCLRSNNRVVINSDQSLFGNKGTPPSNERNSHIIYITILALVEELLLLLVERTTVGFGCKFVDALEIKFRT
jgi:hypothetical protein